MPALVSYKILLREIHRWGNMKTSSRRPHKLYAVGRVTKLLKAAYTHVADAVCLRRRVKRRNRLLQRP
jgi:hypothetical protein